MTFLITWTKRRRRKEKKEGGDNRTSIQSSSIEKEKGCRICQAWSRGPLDLKPNETVHEIVRERRNAKQKQTLLKQICKKEDRRLNFCQTIVLNRRSIQLHQQY